MGIYLAVLVMAAMIVLGIYAFVGLNRQEQARLREGAPQADGGATAGEEALAAAAPGDGNEP